MKYSKGLITGCFDAPEKLHPGHIFILEEAYKHCRELIIGLNSDEYIRRVKNREPMADELDRYIRLLPFGEVVLFENDPLQLIYEFQPEVLIVGDDYSLDKVVGSDRLPVVFVPRLPGHSSSNLYVRQTHHS